MDVRVFDKKSSVKIVESFSSTKLDLGSYTAAITKKFAL